MKQGKNIRKREKENEQAKYASHKLEKMLNLTSNAGNKNSIKN